MNFRAGLSALFALPLLAGCTHGASTAQEGFARISDERVFVMGGRMAASHMETLANPFTTEYEDAVIVGAGYQHFMGQRGDFRFGPEVGLAARIGADEQSAEAWAGGVGRYDGWVVAETVRISPSLAFGVSAVTNTMGAEAAREAGDDLPGTLLFYLSPEIAVSAADNPDMEVFWRIHHRSGAWNTFGGGGSANATMLGLRYGF